MARLPKWQLPWDTLEDWGLNLQVVKTALAAALSWALGSWLFGTGKPYFASLAAILSVQATVAESVVHGVQRILGVVAGIFLAIFLARWLGLHAWSLGVLVFIAMAMATRLHLGPYGIPQVAISALMVLAVGAQIKGYAWYRAADTAVGAAVAIVVSMLLWPPDFTPEAAETLRLLALGLSDVMEGIHRDLVEGLNPSEASGHLNEARAVENGLHKARRAIKRAETSLRWNPWHRGAKARLAKLRQGLTVLDHCVIQARGIARTLFVTLDRDVTQPSGALPTTLGRRLGAILSLTGEALKSYAWLIHAGNQDAALRLESVLQQAHQERALVLHEAGVLLAADAARFLDIASVLVDVDKMSQDLTVSSRLIVPIVGVRS